MRQRTTILRRFARKLAENANASGQNFRLEKPDVARKMGYFLRFVRTLGFERRLLRKGSGVRVPPSPPIEERQSETAVVLFFPAIFVGFFG